VKLGGSYQRECTRFDHVRMERVLAADCFDAA
jgi:hypothetical protein